MKILYDISVLGIGYFNPTARTGIFRAIEELAQVLAKNVDLSFCGGPNCYNYISSASYIKSNSKIRNVNLVSPDIGHFNLLIMYLSHKLKYTNSQVLHYFQWLNPYLKQIINKKAYDISRSMDLKNINSYDIYHSNFFPVPHEILNNHTIGKVITIYDLIPVLYPKYCEKNTIQILYDVLSTLNDSVSVSCISESTKNDLCNYVNIDKSNIFVAPLAASEKFYRCNNQQTIEKVKKKYGIPEGDYVLSLSTLEPRKNITTTIESYINLIEQQNISDLSLVLVGAKGWEYQKIFEEISKSNIRDRIIVTGYVKDFDLSPLYSGARMFVYPSFYEGFGLPPLEAMQCGVPVITSNNSSLPEVVGDAGITIDADDIDGLSDSIYNVYNSDELYDNMSKYSLLQANKFSWSNCAQKTIEIYKKTIERV